jgi:hypothetical protein
LPKNRPTDAVIARSTDRFDPGELLDRAVTLFVRNFSLLVSIGALGTIPGILVSYVVSPDSTFKVWSESLQRTANGMKAPPPHSILLFTTLLTAFLWLLAGTACAIAADARYRGTAVSVGSAYSKAVYRWFAQVLVSAAMLLLVAGVFTVFVFGAIAIVRRLLPSLNGEALLLIVLTAIVLLAAVVTFIYFVWMLAFVRVSIEDQNPGRAIRSAFHRTLAKPVFRRSLVGALVLFAIVFGGIALVESVAGVLATFTHADVSAVVVESIGTVMLNVLLVCFFVVYSNDVRVRLEGHDILGDIGAD